MEVVFIGNEGVLARSGTKAVMIDALFGDGAAPYTTTSQEVIDAVETGRDRFGGVHLILATHYHPDHFNPHSVVRYLDGNPDSHFLSTPQAAALIEKKHSDFAAIRHRIHSVNPAEGVAESTTIGAITVHAFGLSHGKVNYGNVQHLGFLVDLGSEKLLHLGDGIIDKKSLAAAGVFDVEIDACFLPFWYFTYPVGARVVESSLRSRQLFAVHIPPPQRAEIEAAVQDAFPHVISLVTPLSTHQV